jgi:hypothetical protein
MISRQINPDLINQMTCTIWCNAETQTHTYANQAVLELRKS